MNWNWLKKLVGRNPASAANETLPKMTELEDSIFSDLVHKPDSWVIRYWGEGMIRADNREVAIISAPGKQAECGVVVFGKRFSVMWHEVVSDRLAKAKAENEEKLRQATEGILKAKFA